ncbi:MAG: M48 family metalloprotease [Deltaproteobacteria bacterium]|nr:MAG: M48 family metalloprotease [Deltaproteobacteria bacterium]
MAAARNALGALLASALALGAAACIQDDGRRFNPFRRMTEVSVEQEREIGHRFDSEVGDQLVLIDDPVVLGFLSDLGHDIVRQIEPQPFLYRFRVVLDPSLNAFAVPGGYIYFHSGTLLAAGSLDELAGVMGHEIAHVKQRHYARMREQAAIPDLLINIGAIAGAVATGEPGVAIAAQGANVALQLKWSREYEADADQHGAIFMTRGGYEPAAITRFFERILAEQRRQPGYVPPYLYSHPDVEDRIATVREAAETLRPVRVHDPALDGAFRASQARLAFLVASNRTTAPAPGAQNREATAESLEWAKRLAASGDDTAALGLLAHAERLDPNDPEIPFLRAEILARDERVEESIAAYRRTLYLDPTRALVHYQLGRAYRRQGDRQRASFYFEQALHRFGEGSARRAQAEWEIEKLTFPVLVAGGLRAEAGDDDREMLAGHFQETFPNEAGRAVWWGRLGPRFARSAGDVRIRWRNPAGAVQAEGAPEILDRTMLRASLPIRGGAAAQPGRWQVEALLEGDVIDRREFTILP